MDDKSVYELKVLSDTFLSIIDGDQTYLIERDVGFRSGDLLSLREWNPGPCEAAVASGQHVRPCDWSNCPGFTGRDILRKVGVITRHHASFDLSKHVVLSLILYAPIQESLRDVRLSVRRRGITVIDRLP